MPLVPGLHATVSLDVTDADTAIEMRSGSVPVLATPRVVALCEEATVRAVQPELGEGETTVGTQVQLNHVAAVAVGNAVEAEARLERIEGRRLTFTVSVSNDAGLVAVGKLGRVIVDQTRFMEKAR